MEPSHPLEYFFVDENLNQLYTKDIQTAQLVRFFTFISVVIACLGLFGLVSFITRRRAKEIGIRKTLGASTFTITTLVTGIFLKWILLSNAIAWPIAWFALKHWLQHFSYKTPVSWTLFITAGGLSFLIVLFTVAHHIIKASRTNPVDSLRYE